MIKDLLNVKLLQIAFFSGCAVGAAVAGVIGLGLGFGAGWFLAPRNSAPRRSSDDEVS